MTAQFAERLRYRNEDLALCTEPLADYFELSGRRPPLSATSTALWRGYVGHWEILDSRLYLVKFDAEDLEGNIVPLDAVFPGYSDRVFAHWYTGILKVRQGDLLEYVHGGYASVYERTLLIDLRRGIVQDTRVRHNSATPVDAA